MQTTNHASGDALIDALLRRAAELGLQGSEGERLEALLQQDLGVPEPDEQACRRYHAQHADEFREGAWVMASHILFALTPGTPIDALRTQAESALHQLRHEPARFGELARELSNCPSAQQGGELGRLQRGDCAGEFWQALMGCQAPGLLPRLVHSRFGLHIVRIDAIEHGQLPDYDDIAPRIAQRLREQALLRAMRLYLEDLEAQAGAGGGEPAAQPGIPTM